MVKCVFFRYLMLTLQVRNVERREPFKGQTILTAVHVRCHLKERIAAPFGCNTVSQSETNTQGSLISTANLTS